MTVPFAALHLSPHSQRGARTEFTWGHIRLCYRLFCSSVYHNLHHWRQHTPFWSPPLSSSSGRVVRRCTNTGSVSPTYSPFSAQSGRAHCRTHWNPASVRGSICGAESQATHVYRHCQTPPEQQTCLSRSSDVEVEHHVCLARGTKQSLNQVTWERPTGVFAKRALPQTFVVLFILGARTSVQALLPPRQGLRQSSATSRRVFTLSLHKYRQDDGKVGSEVGGVKNATPLRHLTDTGQITIVFVFFLNSFRAKVLPMERGNTPHRCVPHGLDAPQLFSVGLGTSGTCVHEHSDNQW